MVEFIDKEKSGQTVESKPEKAGDNHGGMKDSVDSTDKMPNGSDKDVQLKDSLADKAASDAAAQAVDVEKESAKATDPPPPPPAKDASAAPAPAPASASTDGSGELKASVDIPGYTILAKTDEKSIYTVWKARQESLNRTVAIKILKPKYASNAQAIERFIIETRAIAKLKNQNIIQIYDFGQHDGIPFSVLEFINGRPLSKLLEGSKPLPTKEVITIAIAVAEALDEAWSKAQLFHCYINPDNIMIGADGEIKVSNLGLAGIIRANAGVTRANADMETDPCYMSPELLDNSPDIDFRTDMYSLGAIMYQMLTGVKPFADKQYRDISSAHKFEQIAYPCDLNMAIKPGLANFVVRLMMKEPRYRFKDWSAACDKLIKMQEGRIVVTKLAAGAVSTVAKAGSVAPPAGMPKKAALVSRKPGNKDARLRELKKKYSKQKAPAWLRLPLELAMAVWFGWLGYQLLWIPLHPSDKNGSEFVNPAEVSPAPENINTSSPAESSPVPKESAVQRNQHRSDRTTPVVRHDEDRQRRHRHESDSSAIKSPTVTDDSQNNQASEDAVPPPPLNEVKRDVVKILLKKNSRAALRFLDKTYPASSSPDVEELREFLTSGQFGDKAVAAAFERSIGITRPLVIKGRQRKISVTGVKGDLVSADLITGSGSSRVMRPVTFRIRDVEPIEQSRWLGDPKRADIALTKFMLYMAACDYVKALRMADKCGPLSQACKGEANAKIKMLMME